MVLTELRLPLLTTWPAFAEAMYLLSRAGERRVFTLDSDFQIYRINGRHGFEIIPG